MDNVYISFCDDEKDPIQQAAVDCKLILVSGVVDDTDNPCSSTNKTNFVLEAEFGNRSPKNIRALMQILGFNCEFDHDGQIIVKTGIFSNSCDYEEC